MAIRLHKETEQRLLESIKRYFLEQLEQDVGDLKATLLLDYFVKEIGPSIYNQAIADAQAQLRDKLADLDATCYQPEFGYWKT